MHRVMGVLQLIKSSAKRKRDLTAMKSGVNFTYTMYTWTDVKMFRWALFQVVNLAFLLDPVHCSIKLNVWSGAALYFSKLGLPWSVITVRNRSTIYRYFIWPHFKKTNNPFNNNIVDECSFKLKTWFWVHMFYQNQSILENGYEI